MENSISHHKTISNNNNDIRSRQVRAFSENVEFAQDGSKIYDYCRKKSFDNVDNDLNLLMPLCVNDPCCSSSNSSPRSL